jgi:hypothetical protein
VTEITQQMKQPYLARREPVRVTPLAAKHRLINESRRLFRCISRGSMVHESCWQYHAALVFASITLYVALAVLVADICRHL